MMDIFKFRRKRLEKLKSKRTNKNLPDPNSMQIIEAHLNRLREAEQIVNDVYHNRSEGFQLHHDREICEESIALAAFNLSKACGDLELLLNNSKE
ncbi:MAG: hypothetical protein N0E44_22235 [Candidatus Thiodiazotropha lotti]|nr:hypothetical protein [Candidatus Thiodiazotropha lotti]MCW4222590.1 hypothetical protein [Candidatus Thiodiazotropha lotti]